MEASAADFNMVTIREVVVEVGAEEGKVLKGACLSTAGEALNI